MKQPRGAISRTVGAVASSVADAARRRQGEREPRAVVYDEAGHATLLKADAPQRDSLVEIAERMVQIAGRPADAADADVDELEMPPGGDAGAEDPTGDV